MQHLLPVVRLIGAGKLRQRVKQLGLELNQHYQEQPLTVVALMNGAMFFAADLVRELSGDVFLDSIAVSSYAGHCSSGQLQIRHGLKLSPVGRHCLLLDGVLDTGLTLQQMKQYLLEQGALSVCSCVAVMKDKARAPGLSSADWVGFHLPDLYLVGYGMDSHERYRHLPYVATLKNCNDGVN